MNIRLCIAKESISTLTVMSLFIYAFSAITFTDVNASENIIPTNSMIDWKPGAKDKFTHYPVGVNVKDYGATGNGSKDDTNAFKKAINTAQSGEAVFIPRGTYLIKSTLKLAKGIVLRGDGADKTHLKFNIGTGADCIFIGKYGGKKWTAISSGYQKGSRSITLSNASSFTSGDYVELRQENDHSVFKPGYKGAPSWGQYAVGQILQVTNKSGNTLNLNRPLYYNYKASKKPSAIKRDLVEGAGIENLSIERLDNSKYGRTIQFVGAANSWVRNIYSYMTISAHVSLKRSYRIEIRDSHFYDSHKHNSGGQGYGIAIEHSTDNLVENNIFDHLRHSMLVQLGATGNVFGYNYSRDPHTTQSSNWLESDLIAHGHFPYMNLFEGNTIQKGMIDNVWGTNGPTTIFRNRIEKPLEKFAAMDIRANNPNQNVLGNEFGLKRSNGQAMIVDASNGHTILRHGNYNATTGKTEWKSSISTKKLPNSLYLDRKPAFFGNVPWPPFGPEPHNPAIKIPAQLRYEGKEPGAVAELAPPTHLRLSQ